MNESMEIKKFKQILKDYIKENYGVEVNEKNCFVLEDVVCTFTIEEEERAFKVESKLVSQITANSIPVPMRFDKRCINVESLLTQRVEVLIEKLLAFKAANRKRQ